MKSIIEHFKTICTIPRCSFHASRMKEHIKAFALQQHFDVKEDEAGNVLCKKGHPNVCLQAHYDMVCIGQSDAIEVYQEGSLLKARHSTLGADNGMGIAIMFWAMEHYDDLECLFTADEEVGLLGAVAFSMPLESSNLLNLDAEEAGEIYIGCAGGIDVIAQLPLTYEPLDPKALVYRIHAYDFLGGHSGVDIDKPIASAIKALGYELLLHENLRVIALEGGERRNAIARSATAIVASSSPLSLNDARLRLSLLETHEYTYTIVQSRQIIHTLGAFAQGVRSWDRELDIPSTSINLGLVAQNETALRCDCSVRAMDDENLAILAKETEAYFRGYGFQTTQEGGHGAWKPSAGTFAHKVQEMMQSFYPHAMFKAIHAGLECGELIQRQSKPIEAVSIGPTIRFPHSVREECDVDSVERIAHVVQKILTYYKD